MKNYIAGSLIIGGVALLCTRIGLFGKNEIMLANGFPTLKPKIKKYIIAECCIVEEDGGTKRTFKYWSLRPIEILRH